MIPFLVPDPSMLMDNFEIKKVEVPAEIRNHCIRRGGGLFPQLEIS